MKRMFLIVIFFVLFGFGQVVVQDCGFYVVVKFGSIDVEVEFGDIFDQVIDGDEDLIIFEIGFKMNCFWVVQVGYYDFGNFDVLVFGCDVCGDNGLVFDVDIKVYLFFVVFQIDFVWRFMVFGKVGFVIWEIEVDVIIDDVCEFVDDFIEEDIIYGFGVWFCFLGNFSVFVEWEQIVSDIEMVLIGVYLQFQVLWFCWFLK